MQQKKIFPKNDFHDIHLSINVPDCKFTIIWLSLPHFEHTDFFFFFFYHNTSDFLLIWSSMHPKSTGERPYSIMDVFYGKGVILSLIAVCGELMAAFGFPPENRTEGGFGGILLYVCLSEREMYMDSSRYRTCRHIEKVWHMKIEWKKILKGKNHFKCSIYTILLGSIKNILTL